MRLRGHSSVGGDTHDEDTVDIPPESISQPLQVWQPPHRVCVRRRQDRYCIRRRQNRVHRCSICSLQNVRD